MFSDLAHLLSSLCKDGKDGINGKDGRDGEDGKCLINDISRALVAATTIK